MSATARVSLFRLTGTETTRLVPELDQNVRVRRQQADENDAAAAWEKFDAWVFRDNSTERERRNHLKGRLFVMLRDAAKNHNLSENQRAKLRLAGMGDIKRLFDLIEDSRAQFDLRNGTPDSKLKALERLTQLADTYRQGPFGDGSLFAKTLHKIVEEQKASK